MRTHFRLQIVGGDLWRFDQFAFFSGINFFATAVKEKRDMRVLLIFFWNI